QAAAQRRPLDGQATEAGATQLVLGREQLVAANGGARATEAQVEDDGERQRQPQTGDGRRKVDAAPLPPPAFRLPSPAFRLWCRAARGCIGLRRGGRVSGGVAS